MRRLLGGLASLTLLAGMTACGDDDDAAVETTAADVTTVESESSTVETEPEVQLEGTLTIMAPGPFKMLLEEAKAQFEADNPGVTIELNLAHVPMLFTQLEEGVTADVLITPDAGTMGQAGTKGLTDGDPTVFALVPMALVVPAGNAAGVADVSALADGALRVAVCAAELPCGKLADELATKAAITIDADTLETGGSPGIVTKASTGEIDVGLVFATDIKAGGDKVAAVKIPADLNVSSKASAAVLKASDNTDIAVAFIAFLISDMGLTMVTGKGFLAP